MQQFRSMRSLQKFAAVHSSVHSHFNLERHHYSRENFRFNRDAALAEWRALGAHPTGVMLIGYRAGFEKKLAVMRQCW
jgi:hypothetical protein